MPNGAATLGFGLLCLAMAAGTLRSAGDATTVWTVNHQGRRLECRTWSVAEGIKVQLVADGTEVYSRIFADGEDALQFAEARRLRP